LIIAPITPAFNRFKLREFLLPVTKYMWLNEAQLTYFTNSEVSLARNYR
jgi:hypothetical protein